MSDKKRYLLKNTTKNDINLGDLRYKIPAGQTRDLLSKTAHLDLEDILTSREKGSISKRLGKSLIEVDEIVIVRRPLKTEAKPSAVEFPQKVKSYITIDVDEIEESDEIAKTEEEEFLKELDNNFYMDDDLPIIAGEEDETKKEM